jgi:ATP-dependent DNA helicase RecG
VPSQIKVSEKLRQSEPLKQSVEAVKGVGEERAQDLSQLGIETIGDLLLFLPYRYEDRRIQDLAEAKHDERITIEGVVQSEAIVRFFGRKKSRLTVKVLVDRFLVTAVLFNRHFAKKQFSIGKEVILTGKLDKHRMHITVQDYRFTKQEQSHSDEGLIPVYSVSASISIAYLRKIIGQALKQFSTLIPEIIPISLIEQYKLMPRHQAIQTLHNPNNYEEVKWAKRRMIYEEFFLFQLKMNALRKIRRESQEGTAQLYDKQKIDSFSASLPFTLTKAQGKVLEQILRDISSPFAMNRLLQGDVGSGKTIVAAISLYASITAGHQGALMVPTEILAEQHYESLSQIYKEHNVNIALLTGSTKTKERREILADLQMGMIDLVVGTHALIQENVYFQSLGLVIIDEQHRFGVGQRRKLRQKGMAPDVLFMTATPIPRTLAITAFGDLDVSVIDQLPAGRKPVETYWVRNDMFDRVTHFIHKELDKGRQAYFICPLIEESEKLDLQNAIDLHAQLTQILPQHCIGLMHGRLSTVEKDEVMREFTSNHIHVLVSTTVVEVGVNVPNATLMIVQDAERFGLSQLHQLRGRVGRGAEQSFCILIAEPKTEVGKERMKIMQATNDGFEVAQKDLELRGPGDFFGKKQSGLPEFKIADMIHDYRTLEVAREDGFRLIESPEFWTDPVYMKLRAYLKEEGVLDSEKID